MSEKIDSKVLLEIINGFIRAADAAFESMIFTELKRVGVYIKDHNEPMKGDVSSIVTLFGDLDGVCAISFPRKTAITLVGKMMMDESISDLDDDVCDGLGEIANLIAGGAKGEISNILGTNASISIPTVVTGIGHVVEHNKKSPCIGCIFEAEGRQFFLEVSINKKS